MTGKECNKLNRGFVQNAFSYRKQRFGTNEALNNYIRVSNSTSVILREAAAFIAFEDAAKSVFQREGYSDHFFCSKISAFDDVVSGKPTNAMFVRKGSPLREVFNRKYYSLNNEFLLLSSINHPIKLLNYL